MGTNSFLDVLPEMVTFTRVAEAGSFSAAARLLGMTPSAASRQVTRLEKVLGVQLMLRTTRQLRLTEAGVEAFARCSDMVAAAQGAMDVAQQHAGAPQGRVRISAPKAFARHVLHPHLLTFLRRHPDVDVQLVVTDRDVDPIAEGIDLAVRLTEAPPPGLAARPLMPVEHVLCATPRYLANSGRVEHPRDLAVHSCLALGELVHDHQWRFRRRSAGEAAVAESCENSMADMVDVVVQGRYTVNHSEVRLEAVLADLGIGGVPSFMAAQALADGRVVRVLPDWELQASYRGTAYLLFAPTRFTVPKCRVLIDHLAAALGPA